MVPITINSNPLSAYIDSGASHSSVPAQLITDSDQVRIIQPEPGSKVSLGSKGAFTRRLGSIMLPFEWDGKQFEHVFEIADPPDGIQVIIGRDLFAPLGITISGLPSPFVVGQASAYVEGEFAPDPIVPTSSANPHPVVSSSALQDTIPNNQNIDANSFCNMPEAIVRLDKETNLLFIAVMQNAQFRQHVVPLQSFWEGKIKIVTFILILFNNG